MKAVWEVKPLGEVCDVLNRLRKSIHKRDRLPGPYPYYGATGVIDYVDGYLFDEPLVLVGQDGAKWEAGANSAFSISGKTWISGTVHAIRPHRSKILDNWLIYFLNSSDLVPYVSGVTVPHLIQRRLIEIPIPLPPIEEQQRIVAILGKAFEGLDRAQENTEMNLISSGELFESSTSHLFVRREVQPLGEVCDVLDRLRKPITKRDRRPGPYPYYGATGVIDHVEGYLFDEPLVLVGEDGAKWKAGENSAFAISGKTWVNNHAHVIRPHRDKILDDWLVYFLNSSDLMPCVSGATVPKLNQGRLKEILISLPPIDEQQRIVAILDGALQGRDDILEGCHRSIRDLASLRRSLMRATFASGLA